MRLAMGDGLAAVPCILQAALDLPEERTEALAVRLEKCADLAAQLANFLKSPREAAASLRAVREADWSLYGAATLASLPRNRHAFAEAALPEGAALSLLKTAETRFPEKLRSELATLLAAAAAPAFRLLAGAAHDPHATAELRDIALARLWKRSALLQRAGAAMPWSDPVTWQTEAIANIREAIDLHVSSLAREGIPIASPGKSKTVEVSFPA